MSQIFRSLLVPSLFKQRSLLKISPIRINFLNKFEFAKNTCFVTPKIDSRCFLTKSTVSNHSQFNKKEQSGEETEDVLERDSSFKMPYNQRGNQFNKAQNFENDRFHEKSEQIGIEEAEPVEYNKQALEYASNSESNEFDKYGLNADFLNRLKELGYNKPFEIQEKTLEHTLVGRDLVGKAFTGSGKTLAFAIPIINKILNSQNSTSPYPKCLILSPTRELCLQLSKCIQELAPALRCLAIYGGADYESQVRPLRRGVDIICATPGRLNDLINRNYFVTKDIETICLDEADELLTPNFELQIKDVIQMSNTKQMMMFSATINKNVVKLIRQYMKDPKFIDLTEGQKYKLPTNIEHCVIRYNQRNHADLIKHYLEEYKSDRCIVFTNTKMDAKMLNEDLYDMGIKSSDLHSNHSQNKRARILRDFRSGRLNVLVATDVAARGLDIKEVNLVVQVGFPMTGIEYYIHRSGRCGRAGRIGTSILVLNRNEKIDRDLLRLIKFTQLDTPEHIQDTNESESRNYLSESSDGEFGRNNDYKRRFNSNNNYRGRFNSNDDNRGRFNSNGDYGERSYPRKGYNGYQNNYKKSYQRDNYNRFKHDDDY